MVVLDPAGKVITKEGRKLILADPHGTSFPWIPKPLTTVIGDSFVNATGVVSTRDDISGKFIALYFASRSSLPSKGFLPQLIKIYQKLQADKKPFEIIFVSADKSDDGYNEQLAQMPWLAVPYTDTERLAALTDYFKIKEQPSVVIIDPSLNIVEADGRRVLGADREGDNFPWIPKPLNPLDNNAMAAIDDLPFLLVSTDGEEPHIQAAIAAISPVAEDLCAQNELRMRFFYVADPDEDILDLARRAVKLSPDDKLAILDMTYSKQFVAADQSITADNVRNFVEAYLKGELQEKV